MLNNPNIIKFVALIVNVNAGIYIHTHKTYYQKNDNNSCTTKSKLSKKSCLVFDDEF
jgi:hypothetical protein